MHWTPRREVFRAYLESEICLHPGSVFDPISARIAEDMGFEAGIFAGSVASLAVLGAPDLIVLTLSEFAPTRFVSGVEGHCHISLSRLSEASFISPSEV